MLQVEGDPKAGSVDGATLSQKYQNRRAHETLLFKRSQTFRGDRGLAA
jgi:hypothetical protein